MQKNLCEISQFFNHISTKVKTEKMNNKNKNKLEFLKLPLYICAPMVDQSELPFRMLTRKYGCNLCYTPMLNSKMMVNAKNYKNEHFTTCIEDRPLVAQLCGDDPQTMVKAAKMLENQVDAIDINFGCPQGIARKGHYGSFLLQQPDLVHKIVKALVQNIKVPIFCKTRILLTEDKTFNVINKITTAGCSLLAVHGRTKQQNKERVGECDWKIIKKIKDNLDIPVVANGGIYNFQDVQRCLQQTVVDGVMSAQALLENPALFAGKIYDLDDLAIQYLQLTTKYPGASPSCIRAHLFKMLFTGLQQHIDLRELLVKAGKIQEFKHIAHQLKQRRKNMPSQDKFGWYFRYQKKKSKQQVKKTENQNAYKQQQKPHQANIHQQQVKQVLKVQSQVNN